MCGKAPGLLRIRGLRAIRPYRVPAWPDGISVANTFYPSPETETLKITLFVKKINTFRLSIPQ